MAELAGKRKRARAQLVEVLIGAVCAGGPRLARARSDFERMDAGVELKRLVLQAVDPELLAAVVGPRLVPVWVDPLRAQYARFKQAYPADWVDVEKVWREQRARWRRPEGTAGSVSASASATSPVLSRGHPQRDPDPARAGPPRAGRRPTRPVPAAGPARKPPPAHRPAPAGVATVDDLDVESVPAPPDPVASGAVAEDVADAASRQAHRRDKTSKRAPVRKPAPVADAGPCTAPAPGGAVNGAPVAPAPAPHGSGAASDDRGIVLSGKAGALVERLLQAMADSRARVDSVRRVWIDADDVVGGWDLWALDSAVLDPVRQLRRGMER